jgi:hypothetical protein
VSGVNKRGGVLTLLGHGFVDPNNNVTHEQGGKELFHIIIQLDPKDTNNI